MKEGRSVRLPKHSMFMPRRSTVCQWSRLKRVFCVPLIPNTAHLLQPIIRWRVGRLSFSLYGDRLV